MKNLLKFAYTLSKSFYKRYFLQCFGGMPKGHFFSAIHLSRELVHRIVLINMITLMLFGQLFDFDFDYAFRYIIHYACNVFWLLALDFRL